MATAKSTSILLATLLLSATSYGQTQLAFEDFEDQQWADSFDGAFNPDNVTIVGDESHSGQYAARMHGGYLGAAFDFNVTVSEGDEYYLRYYIYYPLDWDWMGISNSNLKQFRAQGGNGYPIFVYGRQGTEVRTLGGFTDYAGGGVCSGTWYGDPSTPSLGTWHKVEMFVRYASVGGGFWWKVDDEVVTPHGETLDCTTWPSESGEVTNLRICGGNGFDTAGDYFVDDIEIWDGIPAGNPDAGVGGSTSTGGGGASAGGGSGDAGVGGGTSNGGAGTGAGGTAGSGATTAAGGDVDDDGGCGCRAAGTPAARFWPLVAIVALIWSRRRRIATGTDLSAPPTGR